MFEITKKNRIESGVIIGIFILVITLIIYYICVLIGKRTGSL